MKLGMPRLPREGVHAACDFAHKSVRATHAPATAAGGGRRATQKKGFKSQSFKVSEFPASVSLLSSLVRLLDFSVLRRCSG
jgi:hypothetical protein